MADQSEHAASGRPSRRPVVLDPADQLLLATELIPGVEAAAQARALVRDVLRRGGHPELDDTACLLTSELVANAVRHAGAPIELVVDLDPCRLAVEVIDPSTAEPEPRRATPQDTSGRGLAMVERLADEWGVSRILPGKSVWFSLSA